MSMTQTKPDAGVMEHVLGTGDLSKLSTAQRVAYYANVCHSVGLNPLTRPFRFLSFQGQVQLYATRDCADQLRQIRKVSVWITNQQLDGDIYTVTVQAKTAEGREDTDIGAVVVGQLRGESRANAVMRAMTKAKRRVTLSICGLGMLSEDELDTMPGAATFDADDTQPVPLKAAAAATPKPERVVDPTVYDTPPKSTPVARTDDQWRAWLVKLRDAVGVLRYRGEVEDVAAKDTVGSALASAPNWVRREVDALLSDAFERFPEQPEPELPEVEIEGAEKLGAG